MELTPESILRDIKEVGSNKPLGYLPLDTITDLCKEDPEKLAQEAEAKGLRTLIVMDREICEIYSGALYVWDEDALKQLLLKNEDVLKLADWPKEPEAFVRKSMIVTADGWTLLFDLIADAYADYTNPGRLILHKR